MLQPFCQHTQGQGLGARDYLFLRYAMGKRSRESRNLGYPATAFLALRLDGKRFDGQPDSLVRLDDGL